MGKPIESYADLKRLCQTAGLWYVGSFMMEFLDMRDMWENPDTKAQFIAHMFENYPGTDTDIKTTTTRINAVIRIVESHWVIEALNLVLDANDKKLGCDESKINAQMCIDMINSGKLKY